MNLPGLREPLDHHAKETPFADLGDGMYVIFLPCGSPAGVFPICAGDGRWQKKKSSLEWYACM